MTNTTTLVVTGNHLEAAGDLVRRMLRADLNVEEERPELRQFKNNPLATLRRERGRYVAAALTVVQAWLLSGEKINRPPMRRGAGTFRRVQGEHPSEKRNPAGRGRRAVHRAAVCICNSMHYRNEFNDLRSGDLFQ